MQTMTEEQNIDLTHAKAQAGMQKKKTVPKRARKDSQPLRAINLGLSYVGQGTWIISKCIQGTYVA
jgi:hypothetical protein